MPSLRYKEFTDTWEQFNFFELGEIITGSTPNTSNKDYYKGEFLFVSPIDIQDNRYVNKTNTTLTELGFKTGRFIRKGATLFVSIGSTIGKVGQADISLVTNQQINSIVPNNNFNDNFVYSSILSISSKIKQLAAIQAVPIINKTEFGKILINIPTLEEQTKIGVFFKQLDDTIALHQRKLYKLEQIKKSLLQQVFPQKGSSKPQLRLGNFTENWKQNRLKNLVVPIKSYSLSRDVESVKDTGYKYIHYGDIHTKVADRIDELSEIPNIKPGNYELLRKGDLVVADASEDYQGIATPSVVTIDTPYKLVAGLHTIALRPINADSLFLYYLIHSPAFREYGYRIGTGMKVFGISTANLLNFESMIPSLEEQIEIGNFLKQLDQTITVQQRKYEKFKQIKTALLQEMFV